MQQAAHLGDRLIMMYRGVTIHDFNGAEKRRLRADDLLARFEEVRRSEQLDDAAAAMLERWESVPLRHRQSGHVWGTIRKFFQMTGPELSFFRCIPSADSSA